MTGTAMGPRPSTGDLARLYLKAKRAVITAGYARELGWQQTRRPANITEVEFVRQSAWVVLSSGMRETVVRAVLPRLAATLHDFDPCAVSSDATARSAAINVFGHERKIDAILAIAGVAHNLRTEGLRRELARDALGFLSRLPYMGPATSRHLAKNLGVPVAKPDRHLLRITQSADRPTAEALCEEIASWLGEPVCLIDIVLWRWATMHGPNCAQSICPGLPHD